MSFDLATRNSFYIVVGDRTMKKFAAYRFVPEHRLTLEYFEGAIHLEDLMGFLQNMKNHDEYDPTYDVIIDIWNLDTTIDEGAVRDYSQKVSGDTGFLAKRRCALLTRSPRQVVAATFVELYGAKLPMEFQVFHTFQAAVAWLDRPGFTLDNYNDHVKAMKQQKGKSSDLFQ